MIYYTYAIKTFQKKIIPVLNWKFYKVFKLYDTTSLLNRYKNYSRFLTRDTRRSIYLRASICACTHLLLSILATLQFPRQSLINLQHVLLL